MINFITTKTPDLGIEALSLRIINILKQRRPVLWLIPGGSNITISVAVMDRLHKTISSMELAALTVTLTDERFGPVGHSDSNWKQLKDAGFVFQGIESIPVLEGLSADDTASKWSDNFATAAHKIETSGGLVIGQFGVGSDGHIAGIIPNSPAANIYSKNTAIDKLVCVYKSKTYIRVTLTFNALRMVDEAYLFAFGTSKKSALTDLRHKNQPLTAQPAQILKEIAVATVYSDQT